MKQKEIREENSRTENLNINFTKEKKINIKDLIVRIIFNQTERKIIEE